MSEIRSNFIKRNFLPEQYLVKKRLSIPVDSTKPDTTRAPFVFPEETKAEALIIPEKHDSVPISGTEILPVTVETTVAASTTGSEPTTPTPSEENCGSLGGFNLTEPTMPDYMIVSLIQSGTISIPTSYTSDELTSILTSSTNHSNDSAFAEIANGVMNFYDKITNYTIPHVGTISIMPDASFGKNWSFSLSGHINF